MKEYQYTVILRPEPEAGGYSVSVPVLPGCFTQGDNLEEALAMAREAISLYIESLAADGEPIPEELTRPQAITVTIPSPSAAA